MNWLGSFLYYLRHSKATSRYANPAHQSSLLLFIGDSVLSFIFKSPLMVEILKTKSNTICFEKISQIHAVYIFVIMTTPTNYIYYDLDQDLDPIFWHQETHCYKLSHHIPCILRSIISSIYNSEFMANGNLIMAPMFYFIIYNICGIRGSSRWCTFVSAEWVVLIILEWLQKCKSNF